MSAGGMGAKGADRWSRETATIRAQAQRSAYGEHGVPVYATSSFTFESAEAIADAFSGESTAFFYARFDNPNTDEFVSRLAALEGMECGIATASGMSAIFASLLGFLRAGDHVVGSYAVFGSTLALLKEFLPRWGIETTLVDLDDTAAWEAAVRPNTKMFLLETPSNPGLQIADIAAIAKIAHRRNILVNVDNCFATPVLQRPAALGADIVCHSATKYLDGQGRVLGGAVLMNRDLLKEITPFYRSTGPTLSAFNAWLLSRSLETLHLRMERHCATAAAFADAVAEMDGVERVHYPGRKDHPQYELASTQMNGGGGIVTVEVAGGAPAAMALMNRLTAFSITPNLGDARSIVTHPASTTHSNLPPELRERLGITPGLIRVSLGLESPSDLIEDFSRALAG